MYRYILEASCTTSSCYCRVYGEELLYNIQAIQDQSTSLPTMVHMTLWYILAVPSRAPKGEEGMQLGTWQNSNQAKNSRNPQYA